MKKRQKTAAVGSRLRKEELLQIRLNAHEKEAFFSAADVSGMSLSAWIRARLRSSARKELIKAGRDVPFVSKQP